MDWLAPTRHRILAALGLLALPTMLFLSQLLPVLLRGQPHVAFGGLWALPLTVAVAYAVAAGLIRLRRRLADSGWRGLMTAVGVLLAELLIASGYGIVLLLSSTTTV